MQIINVFRASGLPKKSGTLRSLVGQAKPDPYVKMAMGATEYESAVVKNSQEPEWEEGPW
jgi:hypothetical protein